MISSDGIVPLKNGGRLRRPRIGLSAGSRPGADVAEAGAGAVADVGTKLAEVTAASCLPLTAPGFGHLLEELGHHVDTRRRTSDTPGGEGEIFRRPAVRRTARPRWCEGELAQVLELLFDLGNDVVDGAPGEQPRAVFTLGGDVHLGGATVR